MLPDDRRQHAARSDLDLLRLLNLLEGDMLNRAGGKSWSCSCWPSGNVSGALLRRARTTSMTRAKVVTSGPSRCSAKTGSPLGPAVAYQAKSASETDRKVVAHVAEYGRTTNRTIQSLFDMGVHQANSVIDDLVRRQVLVKTSTQQRGPRVEYGRGPRFPARPARKARPGDGHEAGRTPWDGAPE